MFVKTFFFLISKTFQQNLESNIIFNHFLLQKHSTLSVNMDISVSLLVLVCSTKSSLHAEMIF